MKIRRGRMWGGATTLLGTVMALGFAGHHAAVEHVRYYTATEPESLGCFSCHFAARGGTLSDRLFRPRYRSPLYMEVSRDGHRLYVTASQANSLLVVDVASRRVVSEIPLGARPHGVVLSSDQATAFVTLEGADGVARVDLESARLLGRIPTGDAPAGLAVGPDDATLFVSNWFGGDISVADLRTGREVTRLAAGNNPGAIASTTDKRFLLIANQLSHVRPYPEGPSSEVTVVDAARRSVKSRIELEGAHMIEGIAVAPEGDLALVTLVRPKNLVPATQVARGWMMTNGIGVIDLESGRVVQVLLDEPNRAFADPCDVAFAPDGRLAFVSHSGVDAVSVLDMKALRAVLSEIPADRQGHLANHLGMSRRFVRARIPTAANPKGLAVSPDGRTLYAAERLADSIAVIDVQRLEVIGRIAVGERDRETVLRRGERLFNSASHTFQGQFSCRSCHPNNHVDRLQYDFEPDGVGRNIVDNRSLLEIDGTAPFKWNGKNTSLYMQCGLRFAKFLTRVEPFPADDLNALVAFMRSLHNPPNRYRAGDGTLTEAQARGKALFERTVMRDGSPIALRDRCVNCHPPPTYSGRQSFDVGSRSETDDTGEFDTPHLLNLYQSPPYLHDGKALTLEEIWTRFNPNDTHGITRDLSKSDLNDLIEYLKIL